jgi:hypothetical protein
MVRRTGSAVHLTSQQLFWSAADLGMGSSKDDSYLRFHEDGQISCTCMDYKSSNFASINRMNKLSVARIISISANSQAAYCPHVIDYHKNVGGVLGERLAVFDDEGKYWPNHEWRFEVQGVHDFLMVTVYIWRPKPKFQCLQYQLCVAPMPELEGSMWNVYWHFEPSSSMPRLHPNLDWAEGFHIGFYNNEDPLLELAKLAASQFIDIGLGVPCVKCGTVMDPDHFMETTGGRWNAIQRGHYLETHSGVCPSCDETELIPWDLGEGNKR